MTDQLPTTTACIASVTTEAAASNDDAQINDDLSARQSRWGSLISKLEHKEWDYGDEAANGHGVNHIDSDGACYSGRMNTPAPVGSSAVPGTISLNGMSTAASSIGTASPLAFGRGTDGYGGGGTALVYSQQQHQHQHQFQKPPLLNIYEEEHQAPKIPLAHWPPSSSSGSNRNPIANIGGAYGYGSSVSGGIRRGMGSISSIGSNSISGNIIPSHASPSPNASPQSNSLREWINAHRAAIKDSMIGDYAKKGSMKSEEGRKYLEESVRILHSLVNKIVGGYNGKGATSNGLESISSSGAANHPHQHDDVQIHPNFIHIDNVIVRELSLAGAELSADFVECGDSIFHTNERSQKDDNVRKKYLAMDALGRMAYELFMMSEGPSIRKFRGSGIGNNGQCSVDMLSHALSLYDDDSTNHSNGHNAHGKAAKKEGVKMDEETEIIDMLRKNARTTTSEDPHDSGLVSTMLDANIPFSLCRFVSDLLDDGYGVNDGTFNAMFGRSVHSFASFSDILSDLKQMVDDPASFVHNSSPDRWKLSFGNKLYGRKDATQAILDAAERVAAIRDDPIFDGLSGLAGKRKEVVMVSGHSGAGKSHLVASGGSRLEEKGWIFLRCKFDRVAQSEPLSILASALDEYFVSFASCPVHGMKESGRPLTPPSSSNLECSCSGSNDTRERLESIICPEGLAILAKHIPSLRLAVNVPSLSESIKVNEAIIHFLFGQLLQTLSSRRTPILFFIDDLQWVDPLSLAMLTTLVSTSRPDHLPLTSTINEYCEDKKKTKNEVYEEDINVMFVGSYRDNEVGDHHPLTKTLSKFESESAVNVTNISLSGFNFETLNTMLSESLHMPVRRVRSLSEMIMQKTDGRPLHVIEFIQALTMDNLLTHSFARGWEWDADSIDIFPITDSVAELFALKLRRLPRDILIGLQILSCFGSQVDKNVLSLAADYDGQESVDISVAIRVGLSEGLIEQAAQQVRFSHDMIQKATIDSINESDLVSLLRKLASAMIKNASVTKSLDSVLFVIVNLINRIGGSMEDSIASSAKERALFAELNLRAGSKAITVPDFAGAAKYAESGISFLSHQCWETQYEVAIRLYETAVLAHFSSNKGNRDKIMQRITPVFDHSKNFSDQFKTHCVWIKMLSMTDLSRAIKESLNALERLGEPLNLEDIDLNLSCAELMKMKEQLSGERKNIILSPKRLTDRTKMRAMKIMTSLILYYHQAKSPLGSCVACKMIEITVNYGHCEDSVFGAAAFASALVGFLGDVDEATSWARTALNIMTSYDKEILIPSIYGTLYGIVLVWKEPIQSTLDRLAHGIRLSFATGNVEFAMVNTIYYIARSFNCAKSISLLAGEVEALARQYTGNFGNDTLEYSPLIQFYMTPLYNALLRLSGGDRKGRKTEGETLSPLDKVQLLNNDEIMEVTINTKQLGCFHTVLSYQTTTAFLFRDMEIALKFTNLYFEHFMSKALSSLYTPIYHIFYEALICFFFARRTGEPCYQERGEKALSELQKWVAYSDWNFKNKLLLVEAESNYTRKNYDKAATYYEAAVNVARERKFIQEEAIASELSGIFFSEIGFGAKAEWWYLNSIKCFKKWGAFAVAKRVEKSIESLFGSQLITLKPVDVSCLPSQVTSRQSNSKKRHNQD
mmetsp:Transcript_11470/g.24449  ORF Transcript_11470/g.24449 Transcript_11470/m.24449 type:complete len:1640 (+) Transcript_11470:109-5028(+)